MKIHVLRLISPDRTISKHYFCRLIIFPLKKTLRYIRNLLLTLAGILILSLLLVQLKPVQNYVAQRVVHYLSNKLNTTVTLKNVRIDFFNRASLEGLFIADQWQDTLLYAGEAQIRLTDWFFLKDEPELTFAGLKDAYIHLYRKDSSSSWNYDFIGDAFASDSADTGTSSGGAAPQWNLKKISLQQVRFHIVDAWVGNDIIIEAGRFDLNARNIDYVNKAIHLRSVAGEGITIGLRDYKSSEGYLSTKKKRPVNVVDTTPFNPGNWSVDLGKLRLKNSRFFQEDPDSRPEAHEFDPWHIDITGINLKAERLHIAGDTITAKVNDLQATERCGIAIKKMKADVTVSPKLSECRNLFLQTNRSTIRDYYAMRYDRFPDFEDYITKVKMEANLKQSTIAMEDIIYFAPYGLERFRNMVADVSGKAEGTVADLHAEELNINDGITGISGDFQITGLPEIDTSWIVLNDGHIKTTAPGIFAYFPELHDQSGFNISSLDTIDFQGSFNGFYNDFDIAADISTALGVLTTELHLQNPDTDTPAYFGNIITPDFQLGRFLKQNTIGSIALNVDVEGSGFDPALANARVTGVISAFELNNYTYGAIALKGVLQRRQFDGYLKSGDQNLDMEFNGKLDFSGEEPVFDLTARIENLNAYQLHFSPKNIQASGLVKLNFSGNDIDHFKGVALMHDLKIYRDGILMDIDSFQLTAGQNASGEKELSLMTSGIQTKLSGDFSLMDLPESFQLFLSYYIPEYASPPAKVNLNQHFRFQIHTDHSDDMLSIFSSGLRIGNGTDIRGSMNMEQQQLEVQGDIPFLSYHQHVLQKMELEGYGDKQGFKIRLRTGDITNAGSNVVSSAELRTDLFHDTAKFSLLTTSVNNLGNAEINGEAFAFSDSFHVRLLPSSFYLSDKRWEIAAGNEAVYAPDYLWVKNVVLTADSQSVRINTISQPQANQAMIRLENIGLKAINEFIGDDQYQLEGQVNGSIQVAPLLKDQVADFNLKGRHLQFNKKDLGILNAIGLYDFSKNTLQLYNGTALISGNSRMVVHGNFSTTEKERSSAVIQLDDVRLDLAEPFLTDVLDQIRGSANGTIYVSGDIRDPLIGGTVKVHHVGFRPVITGVPYHIDEGTVSLSSDKIDIGTMIVQDESGREGFMNGSVTFHKLSDFRFNLRLNSEGIQALKLDAHDAANFYGDVKAAVQMRLTGYVDDLNVTIAATPLKNSRLFIPVSDDLDLGAYDYIHFKSKEETEARRKYAVSSSYHVRIDALATPDLECFIILDPVTGDQIWARGTGNLVLEIPSAGDIRLNGNYIIDEGRYDFAFKQLQVLNYKRQFQIHSGSSIKWNGSISDAELDVAADAQVKARLYDLISNDIDRLAISRDELRDAQLKQDVNVLMKMEGSLLNPKLSFNLELAENRSVGTFAYQKLQRINTDERELLNQVASLLLLDQFLPPEGFNSTSISTGTINNMSELVSGFASSQITNFTNKILGMRDLYVGVRYKNYNLDNTEDPLLPGYINRNEAGINLRKNFFDNRLIVEVGGVYDWGRTSSVQNQLTANLAGDFRIQYLLTDDGRIRLNVFRNSNYDPIFQENIGRQGLGLMYRKSFNNIFELFKADRKLRSAEVSEQTQGKENNPEDSKERATDRDTAIHYPVKP